MDEVKRKQLEAAGFVVGDFEQFATEVLGMSVVEAREVQFRADLALAICRLRKSLKLTRPAFGKLIGLATPLVARLEIGAPEISMDLMLKVYYTTRRLQVRYEFESPVVASADEPVSRAATPRAASSPRPRKALKA